MTTRLLLDGCSIKHRDMTVCKKRCPSSSLAARPREWGFFWLSCVLVGLQRAKANSNYRRDHPNYCLAFQCPLFSMRTINGLFTYSHVRIQKHCTPNVFLANFLRLYTKYYYSKQVIQYNLALLIRRCWLYSLKSTDQAWWKTRLERGNEAGTSDAAMIT